MRGPPGGAEAAVMALTIGTVEATGIGEEEASESESDGDASSSSMAVGSGADWAS